MRTTLILLSSLALAAASGATGYATTYAFTDATYTADPGMRLDGVTGEQYQYLFGGHLGAPGTYLVYDYTTGMQADPALYTAQENGSTTHLQDGNHFAMSATTAARLTSSVHDLALQTSYGYRYFLDFTNTSGADATITFDIDIQRSHYGRVTGTPFTFASGLGEYAESDTFGDAIDLSGTGGGNARFDDTVDTSAPTYSVQYAFHTTQTLTLAAGQSTRYELYASASDYLENVNPVPEPAPLAALVVGALALLRRRRRA